MSQAPFFLSVTQFTEPNKFKPDSLIEKISHSKSDKSKAESCKNLYKSMQTYAKKKKTRVANFLNGLKTFQILKITLGMNFWIVLSNKGSRVATVRGIIHT